MLLVPPCEKDRVFLRMVIGVLRWIQMESALGRHLLCVLLYVVSVHVQVVQPAVVS